MDAWILSWMPGQGTGFHDHYISGVGLCVASGSSRGPDGLRRASTSHGELRAGDTRQGGPGYIHRVSHDDGLPAVTIHVYSPRLDWVGQYRLDEDGIVHREVRPGRNELKEQLDRRGRPRARARTILTGARRNHRSAGRALRRPRRGAGGPPAIARRAARSTATATGTAPCTSGSGGSTTTGRRSRSSSDARRRRTRGRARSTSPSAGTSGPARRWPRRCARQRRRSGSRSHSTISTRSAAASHAAPRK